jgi:hypothetical protein
LNEPVALLAVTLGFTSDHSTQHMHQKRVNPLLVPQPMKGLLGFGLGIKNTKYRRAAT